LNHDHFHASAITNNLISSREPIHFQMKLIVVRQCRVFLMKNFRHDISSVPNLDYTYPNPFTPIHIYNKRPKFPGFDWGSGYSSIYNKRTSFWERSLFMSRIMCQNRLLPQKPLGEEPVSVTDIWGRSLFMSQ
jgi:hypothetical protein